MKTFLKSFVLSVAALATSAFTSLASDAPASSSEAKAATCGENCCSGAECPSLIDGYVKVSSALAADNLGEAQSAAETLACCLECQGHAGLATSVKAFAKAKTIEDARAQFKGISAAIIPVVEKLGDHYVMTCPMAKADWIQTDATLANPYYGSSMLRCGSIKRTVKGS